MITTGPKHIQCCPLMDVWTTPDQKFVIDGQVVKTHFPFFKHFSRTHNCTLRGLTKRTLCFGHLFSFDRIFKSLMIQIDTGTKNRLSSHVKLGYGFLCSLEHRSPTLLLTSRLACPLHATSARHQGNGPNNGFKQWSTWVSIFSCICHYVMSWKITTWTCSFAKIRRLI
jgi:hypothetical protein